MATSTATAPRPTVPATPPKLASAAWMAFAALALGQLLVDIDDVVLNIALPTIAEEIGIPAGQLPWVVNAYVLCFGGLLLLGGRLADRHGSRTILLAGIATFTVASGFGALAQSAAQVVAARAGQGIAAALLAPAAMSLLVSIFPEPEERSRALGLWGAVTGAGAVLGLVLGGVVTEHLGWRWIFVGNAAVAIVIGASVVALLPPGTRRRDVRIEPWGTLLATVGLITCVSCLHGTLEHGWTDPRTLGLLALSGLALAGAVLVWRRGSAPLVPARLLTDPAVLVSDACAALTGASLLGTFYFVSLHLQEVLGYSPTATAWAYLPLVAGLVVAAGIGSSLVPRLGARPVLMAGMSGCALGLALLALIGMSQTRGSFWTTLFPGLLVCGLGLGLAFVSLTVTAIPGGEQSEDGGVASGLYNTCLQIGGALGIAILATVATGRADHQVAAGGDPLAAIVAGRSLALYVGSALLVAGAIIAALLPRTAGMTGDTDAHDTRAA